VGLTGGMGAGKSTALRALRELGAEVLSTDDVVHELYGSELVRAAVVARWGSEVAPEGNVDRARVARRAFASESEREWLEELLWPLVGVRVRDWAAEALAHEPAPRALVVETPLLFEAGLEDRYAATIAVIAAEEVRAARAAARGQASVDERAARQLPQLEKARRATFTVRNDGTEEQLRERLAALLTEIEHRFVA
jgi:dephospho-CoA kinase